MNFLSINRCSFKNVYWKEKSQIWWLSTKISNYKEPFSFFFFSGFKVELLMQILNIKGLKFHTDLIILLTIRWMLFTVTLIHTGKVLSAVKHTLWGRSLSIDVPLALLRQTANAFIVARVPFYLWIWSMFPPEEIRGGGQYYLN